MLTTYYSQDKITKEIDCYSTITTVSGVCHLNKTYLSFTWERVMLCNFSDLFEMSFLNSNVVTFGNSFEPDETLRNSASNSNLCCSTVRQGLFKYKEGRQ